MVAMLHWVGVVGSTCTRSKPLTMLAMKRVVWFSLSIHARGCFYSYRALACVSQKTRKLLGPESFPGLFSGDFLGSRKVFLKAPGNNPDSKRTFRDLFSGRPWFAAWARERILECFDLNLWLFRGIFFTFKWKTARLWYIHEVFCRLNVLGVAMWWFSRWWMWPNEEQRGVPGST